MLRSPLRSIFVPVLGSLALTPVQRAIAFLRTLGTSAHVWLPGANGVSVASLPSNNYLLSDGSTGYSTVDGVDGLTLDGMGNLGSELVAGNNLSTATVTGSCVKNSNTQFTLSANAIGNRLNIPLSVNAPEAILHTVRLKADKVCTLLANNLWNNSKSLALTMSYQTFEFVLADEVSPHAQNLSFFTAADSPVIVDVEYVSSKQYSGIHLTQATTANKPLVRRGMLSLLIYGSDLTNGVWTMSATSGSGNLIKPDTTSAYHRALHAPTTIVSGASYTLACRATASGYRYLYINGAASPGAGQVCFDLQTGTVAATANGVASLTPVGDGSYICCVSATSAAAANQIYLQINNSGVATDTLFAGDGTSGIYVYASGLFAGTFTAAQILAEGGIPTTTATAASNPTSGKYWWSFDGNDSLAAGSVPFQFSDDFCLHFSARLSAASGNQTIYAATNVAGDRAPWVRFGSTGKVVFQCFQATGTLTAEAQSTATYVGQAIIIRCRKVGSTITLWINGVQVASASTAALTSMGTITTALFGQFGSGALYYTGALGWSVSVTGTQTDADGLTIDRLLASTFPGAPVF